MGKKRKLDSSESEGYDSDSDSQTTPQKNIRCHKRLMKEQYKYFKQHGFTDELITIVLDEGLDKINIENYVLLYNHQNNEHVPLLILSRQKDIYGRSGGEKEKNPKSKNKTKVIRMVNQEVEMKTVERRRKIKVEKEAVAEVMGKKDGNDEGGKSSMSGKKGKGSKKYGMKNKTGKDGDSSMSKKK